MGTGTPALIFIKNDLGIIGKKSAGRASPPKVNRKFRCSDKLQNKIGKLEQKEVKYHSQPGKDYLPYDMHQGFGPGKGDEMGGYGAKRQEQAKPEATAPDS